jgi:hypothetical protein
MTQVDVASVDVIDLTTGEVAATYVGVTPKEAVALAFVQLRLKNFNTWDYTNPELCKQIPKIEEGKYTVACGDFCALKW